MLFRSVVQNRTADAVDDKAAVRVLRPGDGQLCIAPVLGGDALDEGDERIPDSGGCAVVDHDVETVGLQGLQEGGGRSIIDMGNMPILVTPNEYRDGIIRSMQ